MVCAADLISVWDQGSRAPPHQRLGALLTAIEGREVAADTLGTRNRRLLALHRALVGTRLEAHVTCTHCKTESEFVLPIAAILAAPLPDARVRVPLRVGSRTLRFRLPCMADIEAARGAATSGDVAQTVLERCRIGKGGIPSDAAARLAPQFEALDPAANIIVNIECSGCARPIAAAVDVASFVARDLDRLTAGLFRDVDVIASAYGWSEQAILELPPARRRRYVALITGARTPMSGRLGQRA